MFRTHLLEMRQLTIVRHSSLTWVCCQFQLASSCSTFRFWDYSLCNFKLTSSSSKCVFPKSCCHPGPWAVFCNVLDTHCLRLSFPEFPSHAEVERSILCWAELHRFILCTRRSGGTAHEGGFATSQLVQSSLTPLSVAGCGWLQLRVPHWATSVDYWK